MINNKTHKIIIISHTLKINASQDLWCISQVLCSQVVLILLCLLSNNMVLLPKVNTEILRCQWQIWPEVKASIQIWFADNLHNIVCHHNQCEDNRWTECNINLVYSLSLQYQIIGLCLINKCRQLWWMYHSNNHNLKELLNYKNKQQSLFILNLNYKTWLAQLTCALICSLRI